MRNTNQFEMGAMHSFRALTYDERYQLPNDCSRPSLKGIVLPDSTSLQLTSLRNYVAFVAGDIDANPSIGQSTYKNRLRRFYTNVNSCLRSMPFKVHTDVIPDWARNAHGEEEFNYFIYDKYFGFGRYFSPATTPMAFLIEFLRVARDCAADLVMNTPGCRPVADFFRGMDAALGMFSEELYLPLNPSIYLASELEDIPDALLDTDIQAFNTWRVHHAMFAFFANMATAALSGKVEKRNIESATIFFRGTTVAMWSAVSFGAEIYNSTIRPSMRSSDAPHGFTGRHNKDYSVLLAKLGEVFEMPLSTQLPADELVAVKALAAAYLDDGDEHIQIALKMIGAGQSLQTEKMVSEYGASSESAISILERLKVMRTNQVHHLL
ncbi:hypothetical protein LZD49_18380 [Dyadobacter sp. CY261]|uniref:hypothetical protein n=1 Tax=Dyadobacter sp. CY261 TaxID=2907203 RepID=UPI001F1B7180|nr:hypothetical protein [Dyadobacter sp. CY261]MCF0072456.1 hypothetical protein [Dyadobacter sp. CY261]